MRKIRLAAVKYLNTLPMLHGLQNAPDASGFELYLGHPAECARLLMDGEVDIALCPVGALPDLPQYHIASQFGIGCKGPVRTVSIYSDSPLEELKAIKLYGESRSSNILVQVLDREYWKLGLQFVSAEDKMPDVPTGQLVIGDACFEKESEYQQITDLGDAWFNFTGLPFLFACWVSINPVHEEIRSILDNSFASGIADLANLELPTHQLHVNIHHYLRDNIQYKIDEDTLEGMSRFINYAGELNVSSPDVNQAPSGQPI